MATRNVYGLRSSLAKGQLESQIQFGSNTSLSFAKKPITLATFIYLMGAIFIYALLYSRTAIHFGGWIGWLLFTIGYLGCYWAFFTRTDTINYKLSYLPVLFRYWRRHGREVKTQYIDNGAQLRNLLGIKPINGIDEDGTIHHLDGEISFIFDVVGNASSMIFEQDQQTVIKDARTIYKNLPSGIGLTLVTQASVQDVHIQLQYKLDQLHNLELNSPGLKQVVKKQGLVLRDTVGTNFSMIRQYLIVRGPSDNALMVAKTIASAAQSSTNSYLKSAELLTNEKLRKGPSGLPLNEPWQVEKFLETIFNDYGGK